MSKTKSAGSTSLGRDSNPKYLGIKLSRRAKSSTWSYYCASRGSKFIPGNNVRKEGMILSTLSPKYS